MSHNMPKRYTMTEKWTDEWFLKLSPPEKLLWNYLCDTCDIAGFWEKNFTLASLLTGIPSDEIEGAFKGLTRGYFEAGAHIWLRTFIKHQKNLPLNPDNRCHKAILRSINEHNSFGSQVLDILRKQTAELNIEGACKGLVSPYGKGNGKGNGKGKGKEARDFETFWKAYPKKRSKDAALRRWNSIKPNDDLLKTMLAAIEQQKKSESWMKDGGQFIPYPATWLNGGSWKDENVESRKLTNSEKRERYERETKEMLDGSNSR